MIKKIILLLSGTWLAQSALIDFTIVPTIFRTIKDFFNAGELAISLFAKFNLVELFISSTLVGLASAQFKFAKKGKLQLIGVLASFLIVIFYFTYLTPRLAELTQLWTAAEAANQMGIAGIKDIQQEHQSYHRLYVTLDSVKMLILFVIIGAELNYSGRPA